MTRAPDICDQAQDLEERMRDEAIERNRWHRSGMTAAECKRCGAAIAQARRDALPGVKTCVQCAAELEARAGLKGS